MANMCKNILRIQFYDKEYQSLEGCRAVIKALLDKSSFSITDSKKGIKELGEDYIDIDMYTHLAAPIDYYQEVCDKYNVDIIGVAYDFDSQYVESFELYCSDPFKDKGIDLHSDNFPDKELDLENEKKIVE